MPKFKGSTTFVVLSAGAAVAGCQSAPARYADGGFHATYAAASTGAGAVRTTSVELYQGAGRAVRAPLRDLNMMQDPIPPVLLRAENKPYDLESVNSCADVLNGVAELDLALGPDVDTPKQRRRTRVSRGADFAASTALDAAGSAAEHFIPMRGTIKQISGAARYERHAQHAILAGETRRSFLKAVGMAHNCSWPAAPLGFKPTQVADVNAAWGALAGVPGQPSVMLASASESAAAQPSATAATARAAGVQPATTGVAPAVQTAALTASSAPSRVVMVSSGSGRRPAVYVPVSEHLSIPPVTQAAIDPAQAWRPAAASRTEVLEVSAPVSSPSAADAPVRNISMTRAAMTSASGTGGLAPWSSAFAGSSGGPSAIRP
jgi:hypothetical protein